MSKTFKDYLKETEEQNRWVEETYDGDDFYIAYGDMWFNEDEIVDEAEYQGRKVKLGKPMRGDVKKFKVYVKDPKTKNFKNKETEIRKEINKIIMELIKYEPKLTFLRGKEVLEVKPLSHNKGTAISYFMRTKPFIKRRPIFIGDDISDEDGFETVNKIGGWSVRVGNYKRSKANFFLPNVKSVHEIMKQLLKSR